jgi:hypothetical protein
MNIRINNIEFKKYISTKRDKSLYEIVKWYPNIHFGKEEEYKKDGYVDSFGGEFLRKDGHEIHKSFFINPESCYVIAFIEKGKESWELRSVGERVVTLAPEELEDFNEVYKIGQTKLNKL